MPVTALRLRKPGGLDRLDLAICESRPPAAGEIRMRIRASSLNYHDYAVVIGAIPTDDGRIPLSDGAGEVLEVGAGVTEFAPGSVVISTFFPDWLDGAASQQVKGRVPGDHADGFARAEVTAPATSFTRAPAGYSIDEAATLPCAALTAWRALAVNGRVRPGDLVLVQGSGGVSLFALQFARAMGARVVATSSSDEKLERLKGMGAELLVNYRTTPDWGDVIRRKTGGVDHVVEVGGAGTLQNSLTACAEGGHVAMIGVLTGLVANVQTALIMRKQLRVEGVTVGSRRDQMDMIRAIETTGIRPVIDSHFPLAETANAFRHEESGTHFGKICVEIP